MLTLRWRNVNFPPYQLESVEIRLESRKTEQEGKNVPIFPLKRNDRDTFMCPVRALLSYVHMVLRATDGDTSVLHPDRPFLFSINDKGSLLQNGLVSLRCCLNFSIDFICRATIVTDRS